MSDTTVATVVDWDRAIEVVTPEGVFPGKRVSGPDPDGICRVSWTGCSLGCLFNSDGTFYGGGADYRVRNVAPAATPEPPAVDLGQPVQIHALGDWREARYVGTGAEGSMYFDFLYCGAWHEFYLKPAQRAERLRNKPPEPVKVRQELWWVLTPGSGITCYSCRADAEYHAKTLKGCTLLGRHDIQATIPPDGSEPVVEIVDDAKGGE